MRKPNQMQPPDLPPGRRICNKCEVVQWAEYDFYRAGKHLQYFSAVCKSCTRKNVAAYGERSPMKRAAQRIANNAIASGLLVPEPCRDCGKKKVDAHHPDYSKPLDVIWLCRTHHILEHSRMNASPSP